MGSKAIRHNLVVRPYKYTDYIQISKMWEGWQSKSPPLEVLGSKGVVVEYDNNIVCAIFLYNPTSAMGMMQFEISNRKFDKSTRDAGIDLMLDNAIELLETAGYKYIFASTGYEKFKKRLESKMFKGQNQKQYHLFRGIS